MNVKAILALCLVHFAGDFYQSFFHPLFPVLREQYGISLTQIGVITGVVTCTSFLAQPLTGYLADGRNPKTFMLLGLGLSATLIPLLGLATWFPLLLLVAGAGALGSSLYHPAAAGLVPAHAGERTGLAMSLFGLGGALAFTVGPLAVTAWVSFFGLERLPWLSLVGVACIGALLFLLPGRKGRMARRTGERAFALRGMVRVWKPLLALWGLCVLRAMLDTSLKSFYPILYVERGNSLLSMGLVLTLYMLGGSVSALVSGQLVDTRGYRGLFFWSFALTTPCLLLFLGAAGWWLYPAAFLAGFVLLATMFPAVALAARIAPGNTALATSLTLGFSTGVGGLMAPLVGGLAEAFGVQPVLTVLAFAPLLGLGLALYLFASEKGGALNRTERGEP